MHLVWHVHQQCKKGCYICDETVKIGPEIDLLNCFMLRQSILKGLGRHGQAASESHTVRSAIRSFYTNTTLAAKHISADHKKVSTPDEGDIGRGTHEPAPVEAGDPSDVVPNLVMPDEKSGKVPKGVEEVKGFKSGSGSTPELATQTTAKPGQEREEVATSPTPGLAPTKKIAPNKSVGSSWRPVSAFKQSRYMHTMVPAYKEDLGDREEQDMPAAGIATSGPGTGSSNTGDAGPRKPKDGKLSGEKSKEDAKTKPFFDVDEGGKGTQVGPAGDNETFKSQGRDTQGKGDTLGIGDKKGDNKGPGPGTK